MRAIASLVGLALLGFCLPANGQRPLLISEPVSQSPNAIAGEEPIAPPVPLPGSPAMCDVWQGDDFGYGQYGGGWWRQAWYLRTEALFLQRSQGFGDRVLVQSGGGTPLISSGDFSFDFQPGVSTLLGHRLDSQSAWELVYLGAHQWNETQVVSNVNNLDLPGAIGMVADDFNNADSLAVSYLSHLNNAEINYLRDYAGVSWLIGFRYLNWEESLGLQATDNDGDISDYDLGTSNNLFGLQIGGRAARYGRRWDWELTGKAGVFGNDIVQRQSLTDNDGDIVLRNVSRHGSGGSFVGDINLSTHCKLSDVWRLRAGYNILWITDLALAPDQVDFSNAPLSGTAIDRHSTIFLHGLNFGLEALW